MPSPGSLQRLRRPRNAALHTVAECDQQLERLADLARAPRLQVRVDALRRIDVWLDERLCAMRAS